MIFLQVLFYILIAVLSALASFDIVESLFFIKNYMTL